MLLHNIFVDIEIKPHLIMLKNETFVYVGCYSLQLQRNTHQRTDHKGIINLYERSHLGSRVDSDLYSLYDTTVIDQSNFIHPDAKALQLECHTLDSILADHKVDVMKIDIEGAEVSALKGATNTLKHLRKIIVEIHGDNFEKENEILERSNFNLEVSKEAHIIGSKVNCLVWCIVICNPKTGC